MSESLSLYRRHRPGSFDQVVGQQHVVRTLRNAVEQDKVHHAYLFVGSRGTGKTSMAKILARSLNCVQGGPTVNPCGVCESCRSIAAGTSVDVIEMDAASNRSVDDIRDLRERVAYAPAAGGWKVYILDEAHMLTKEAWNAFLKTLEEPPPNTVFVLATTEAHKVMPTITDRCQRFDFQRPSLDQIATVLKRVAEAEQIEIEDPAVAIVARSASGSFRDALGTLDQLVSFNGPQVSLSSVLEMLGAVDTDLLFETVDAVAAEDAAGALRVVEKMSVAGRDPTQFTRDLLGHLHGLLVLQTTGELPDSLIVAAEDAGRLSSQAASIGGANLIRLIDELGEALAAIRAGDEARMAVEVALLKAARPDFDPSTQGLIRRMERIERHLAGKVPAPPSPPSPAAASEPAAAPASAPTSPQPADPPETSGGSGSVNAESPTTAPESSAAPAVGAAAPDPPAAVEPDRPVAVAAPVAADSPPSFTEEAAGSGSASIDELTRLWPAIRDHLSSSGQSLLAALFDGTRPLAINREEATLEIGFPPSAAFNLRQVEEPERRKAVAEAIQTVLGERLRPNFILMDSNPEPDEAEAAPEVYDEDEIMEQIKTQFNAEEVT